MLSKNQLSFMAARNEVDATGKDDFELDDIVDYAGATALDIGLSLVNSVVWAGTGIATLGQAAYDPGLDTGEWLHALNEDAGDFYDQHKDLVQLSSFIGGMFVPGMLAAKQIRWAKSTGRTWIGGLEKNINYYQATALKQVRKAGEKTKLFNQAKKDMRLSTLKSGLAEGIVYELEFAAMMNQHAYLDNDYDVADFAIGAVLGGLIAPIRLIQQNKILKIARVEAKTAQLKSFTQPIYLQGEDAGTTLAYNADMYNNWKIDDTAQFSEEVANQHTIAGLDHVNGIFFQINKMAFGDKALQSRINFTVSKDVINPRNFNYTNALFADPGEILGNIAVKDAGTFKGVTTLRTYNAEKPMKATIEGVLKRTADGSFDIATGQVAKDVLFPNFTRLSRERNYKQIVNSIPTGLEITNDGVHIAAKQITKNMRRWMAEYFSLPIRSVMPVKITGNVDKLKVSSKALHTEAAMRELEATLTHKSFITHDELLEKLGAQSSSAAIVDPFMGDRLLSEVDMLASAGANSYPSMKIANPRSLNVAKIDYTPFQQSVARSDRANLEAMIAVENHGKVTNLDLDFEKGDTLPILQALLNKYTTDWPIIRDIKGKQVLANKEDAAKYIWGKKQELIREGKVLGASELQIARVTNTPLETVEAVLVSEGAKLPFDAKIPLARYDTNNYQQYLKNIPTQVEGNLSKYGKVDELNTTAMLDKADMIDMYIAVSRNIIETSGVPQLAHFMNEVLFTPISKAIRETLPKAMAATENQWSMFTSADHALRELGVVGEWITSYGSMMSTATNLHIEKLQGRIQAVVSAVATNPASRVQFSHLRQALHALDTKAASKIIYDPGTGKILTGELLEGKPVYLKYYGLDQELVLDPKMMKFMDSWLPVQHELLALHNTTRKLHGLPSSSGAGIWLPYSELNKDFVAFQINKATNEVSLLTATNAAHLAEDVAEARSALKDTHDIITKADSAAWLQIHRYSDLEQYRVADISSKKRGITSGTLVPGITDIDNFMGSIQRDVWTKYRRIARASNSAIHDQLDLFARREIAASGGESIHLAQKVQRKVSTPELVSKTMLNESMVHTAPMLDLANNWTTVQINTVFDKVGDAWGTITRKSKGVEADYVALTAALKEANIPVPWDSSETYAAALRSSNVPDSALHRIQQAQSVLVMLNLRLLEFAHAAVTVMSFPVILQGELTHRTGSGGRYPLKHMVDSWKFWMGDTAEAIALREYAEMHKFVKPIVAETTRAMQDFHTKTNIFGKHEELLNKLSIASDWSEGAVREQAFANGYLLAKKRNPGGSLKLWAAEAYAFTARTMGNYVPRQRPTMFQGTFGTMIGLYQTFMLTMGQNMFRYMEVGDAKAMRNLWTAQGSMFGLESLPMYQQFNHLLGGYMSDDHEDIRSTVYDVFGSDTDQTRSAAEHMLFGMPSAIFGAGIYTRGALDPRSPIALSSSSGLSFKPAVLDAAIQSFDLAKNLATAATKEDTGRAILQGFAAQSLWRPGARYAELFGLGVSFDRKGELISSEEEVKEPFAVLARVFGARPLKEQALRNLRFSNTYYNTIDRDHRARYTKELRRIVTAEPEPTKVEELFVDFVQSPGGTYRGWKQIANEAFSAVSTPYANRLVDDMKRQPTIQHIVDTYAF